MELHICIIYYKHRPRALTLSDPLKWWNYSEAQLLNLAKPARIIFSGMPTPVPSEMLISTAAGELSSIRGSIY